MHTNNLSMQLNVETYKNIQYTLSFSVSFKSAYPIMNIFLVFLNHNETNFFRLLIPYRNDECSIIKDDFS